jgi:hypothetical protein
MHPHSGSRRFWKWFQENEAQLRDRCGDSDVWDEIDKQVDAVDGELAWELGPLCDGKMYFAISPDLQEELVDKSTAVVRAAYKSAIWEFRLGRQRRPWNDALEIARSTFGQRGQAALDLKDCVHIAFRVPATGKYDIVFACPEVAGLDEDVRDEIGWILAVGLVGEMLAIERIDSVSLDPQLGADLQSKSKPAAMLPALFGLEPAN